MGGPVCLKHEDGKWYAIGVMNTNWSFNKKERYTVSTRVSALYKWIVQTVASN
jgi:hypothetical protein